MNTSKVLSIAALMLAASLANGEEKPKDAGADPNVRPAGEVVLRFERKVKIPEIKRFEDGVLEIFPGDTVHLEFEEVDGALVRPKVVAKVTRPERTITFRMTQDESITMLFRNSEIQKTVALDCEHKGLGSDHFSKTNLQPTEKGLMAGDSWPNSVWMLRLKNIEVTSKSAAEVYEEKISRDEPSEEGSDKPDSKE